MSLDRSSPLNRSGSASFSPRLHALRGSASRSDYTRASSQQYREAEVAANRANKELGSQVFVTANPPYPEGVKEAHKVLLKCKWCLRQEGNVISAYVDPTKEAAVEHAESPGHKLATLPYTENYQRLLLFHQQVIAGLELERQLACVEENTARQLIVSDNNTVMGKLCTQKDEMLIRRGITMQEAAEWKNLMHLFFEGLGADVFVRERAGRQQIEDEREKGIRILKGKKDIQAKELIERIAIRRDEQAQREALMLRFRSEFPRLKQRAKGCCGCVVS